ncbi:MAG: sigma-54-dependent Fis family transcriptional regulator [Melioribacteraceae bacterium]|nr:sigma-54-dependent Fis family transcriptional regulator [Melioribacteraceae bacterium]
MQKEKTKILIVDDNPDVLLAAKLLLKPHIDFITTEEDPNKIPNLLDKENYDVILLDMNFTQDVTSGHEGFYWLNKIIQIDPSAVVLLITAFGDVEMAVKAVKEGATDFVLKPWQNEKFLTTITSALKLRESKVALANLRNQQKQLSNDLDQKFHNLIGISDKMKEVFDIINKVALTEANVLILGENGTGKELVARALHRQSQRAEEAFINLDMGAISSTLFESELFGHVKGAFTDAREDRAGRFEIASGGSLFLDEIGNLPLELQPKLLSVLQNREVRRVGSNKLIPIDIRLICATNMPLSNMVNESKFRQDLLYRINTVEINLPPLRERVEDIPLLSEHFLISFRKKYNKDSLDISKSALDKMKNYTWPGNIRELQHTLERSVIMSESPILTSEDIFLPRRNKNNTSLIFDTYNLEEIEKNIIKKIVKKHDGNISKAAKELGLTRTSLYRRLEKFGL